MMRAVGRTEVNELVYVVLNTGYTEHRVCHEGRPHAADGKTVGLRSFIDVIGSLAASPGRHILDDQCGVSRNMFAPKGGDSPRPHIGRATGRTAQDNGDRFVFIKRRL